MKNSSEIDQGQGSTSPLGGQPTALPSREQVITVLNQILEDDFEVDPGLLRPEASLRDDLDLDSLDGVDLVVAIEKKFAIRIDEEEARSIRLLKDIYDSIERHLEKLRQQQLP